MSLTKDEVLAFARHIVSFITGGIAFAVALHAIEPTDAANATNAINQIGTSLSIIIGAVATLIATMSGVWASITASPLAQIFKASKAVQDPSVAVNTEAQKNLINATASLPSVDKIVSPLADSIPATNVVKE